MARGSIQIKLIGIIFPLFFFFTSKAQQSVSKIYSQQLSITTENDYYLFQGKDAYYTNGIILNYSRIHHTGNTKFIKQIDQYEIGQKLYTAFSRKIYHPEQIDRPIAGYLYAKFSRSDFMINNRLFQWGVSLGTIGKASLGEQMQDGFHKLIHVNPSIWGWIWNYQVRTEPGVNLHALYAKGLVGAKTTFFQLTPVTNVTLGTSFTNISQGIFFQFGKLKLASESAYWNAALEENRADEIKGSELFFYYSPDLKYQLYDATIQGGLFRKDKGPIISTVKPFVFTQQLGALYSFDRYTLRLGVVFETRDASSQRFNHTYGSIQGRYRFH
ncbi:MAG: lipid A deacylase LpxR family protein [Ginsengibacter sp.]